MTEIALDRDLDEAVAALAGADRVLVVTHENPDGDAIGCMSACWQALRQLGKEMRLYLHEASPMPHEYGFLPLGEVERTIDAETVDGWTLLAVDCGNERRLGPGWDALLEHAERVVDIDHHHDNSRFGDVNLIDGHASCTAEILERVFDRLGVRITPEMAEALYVALVTDTGRFQYRTTSPEALRFGARLVDAGADIHKVFERVFESVPFDKTRLLGRVLDHAELLEGGRLVLSFVTRDDLALVDGDEATTEGLIDHLRAVEGVQVAALIREQVPGPDGSVQANRVSLRSRGLIDVSRIARKSAGGGHLQAAGFSHPGDITAIRDFIVAEVADQLAEHAA
jgi:bifunctional oligoribonuclease and PAP phosphatase NrnA